MTATPDLSIANEALAECPQDPIQSPGEGSLAAREITRAYDAVVREVLSLTDWETSRKYGVLAEIPNDRPQFWAHAYQAPADLITPQRLVPSFGNYDPVFPDQYLANGNIITYPFWATILAGRYEIAGSTLYTMEPMAVLAYTSSDAGMLHPLLRRAIVVTLASRIVLPITKSVTRQQALMTASVQAQQLAMSADFNRQPRTYGNDFVSTTAAARSGWIEGYPSGAWIG